MAIKFCPKCGSIMVPEKDGGKIKWVCRKCGHKIEEKGEEGLKISQKVESSETIPIVDLEKQKNELSTIDIECPKCHKRGAIWWLQQTRSGDEPSTRFYKCIHCGFVWREYA